MKTEMFYADGPIVVETDKGVRPVIAVTARAEFETPHIEYRIEGE